MPFTSEHLAAYRRDGFVVVPGLFAEPAMAAACAAMERIFYGTSFSQWRAEHAAGRRPEQVPDGITAFADGRRTRWPVGDDALDTLIQDDGLLDACARALGGEPFFCAAVLFLRCGPTDDRFPAEPWSGWHFDHFNNGLLPPSPELGRYEYVNAAVHLHDVGADDAPTLFVPGSHARAAELAATGLANDLEPRRFVEGTFDDVRRLEGLPPPVAATGPRGALLLYSSFVLHRAQPFGDRTRQRALWTLSAGRRDNATWCRHTNPFAHAERDYARVALARCSARVRTLLGWPGPGDPYYTPATLGLLAAMYPGIDLAPYRAAMR